MAHSPDGRLCCSQDREQSRYEIQTIGVMVLVDFAFRISVYAVAYHAQVSTLQFLSGREFLILAGRNCNREAKLGGKDPTL